MHLNYLGASIFKAQITSWVFFFFFPILSSPQGTLSWAAAVANGLILLDWKGR